MPLKGRKTRNTGHGRPVARQGLLLNDTDDVVVLPSGSTSEPLRERFPHDAVNASSRCRGTFGCFGSPLPGSWRVPPHVTNFFLANSIPRAGTCATTLHPGLDEPQTVPMYVK